MAGVSYNVDKLDKLLQEINENYAAQVRVPGTYYADLFFDLRFTVEWAKEEEVGVITLNTEEMKFLEALSGQS